MWNLNWHNKDGQHIFLIFEVFFVVNFLDIIMEYLSLIMKNLPLVLTIFSFTTWLWNTYFDVPILFCLYYRFFHVEKNPIFIWVFIVIYSLNCVSKIYDFAYWILQQLKKLNPTLTNKSYSVIKLFLYLIPSRTFLQVTRQPTDIVVKSPKQVQEEQQSSQYRYQVDITAKFT